MNQLENECAACGQRPNCGQCPYRFCKTDEDYEFVTKLCSELRDKQITNRQFTFRYRKRFGVSDLTGR